MAVIRWERQDALGDQLRQLGRPVIKRIVEAGADTAVAVQGHNRRAGA